MPRLTDAQLFILCTASLRDDRAVEAAGNSKGEYQQNAIKELIHLGLLADVRASGLMPVWRRDEHNAPIGLRITGEGLKAIGVDDETTTASQPAARPTPNDKIETAGHKAPGSRKPTSAAPRTSYRKKKRRLRVKSPRRELKVSKQDQVLSLLGSAEGASTRARCCATP